ncbi:mannitol dehydrogenase family protein [Leadbettera azotonutricia]|uniref:D-mannonate oxidoreductase (Fructuronate reductase) n=1 Tax=Leadbettera azotonutricia (strain ATCC BAA-888 / DSM 13862 / ZAS-9) TaxID=545695 RepID=F5YAL2_LEAAZ|nr:mannitol dehydrogenase family protein [Leadbettera azotonutricia]AEF81993.1 D-mannonate oxidoreductase (Fructuronate reductase) [Leadbettera azotonutricia ZAS-9]
MNSIQLSQTNLSKLNKAIHTPSYDRNQRSPAIVHLGLGHFHRAHMAFFLDALLKTGITRAGIFEVNLVPDRLPIGKILKEQDYLYTLLTKSGAGNHSEAPSGKEDAIVIGSILSYANASDSLAEKNRLIEKVASGETALVSLTITEKGYCFIPADFTLDLNHPAIKHDLEHPEDPQSAVGFLAAVLSKRSASNRQPLTIMSCDNFPSNGETLSRLIRTFCEKVYPSCISWIEENVAFPCSMVDRITPNTTPAHSKELEEKFGIIDNWPVCSEDFIQWVLEDNFLLPPGSAFNPKDFAKVGVQLVKDVEPYEHMKQRILNGSHSALAYTSYLMGIRKVDEAMADPQIFKFVRSLYMEEAGAALPPIEGVDLKAYKDTTANRFCNPNISDTILRLCEDGSTKIPNFILRPLKDALQQNLGYHAFVFALAGWARFLTGSDEQGQPIPINDPNADALKAVAAQARENPAAFLRSIGVADISDDAFGKLTALFKDYLEKFYSKGARESLGEFLKQ